MGQNTLENLRIFKNAEIISDLAWEIVKTLPRQEFHPTGNQFIRSADSVSANIAEGHGRHTFKDKTHYFIIARASLSEAKNWLRIIASRYSVPEKTNTDLKKVMKEESYMINKYIKYLRSRQ